MIPSPMPYDDWRAWASAVAQALEQRDREQRLLVVFGHGSPEGRETAPRGTIYIRLDGGAGTTLYVKETAGGNTGWAAK